MHAGFDPLLAFGWSVFAGFIMSMGAGGGGVIAGVGHISILGIGDANTIKVANQILEFASRVVSVPLYYRQKRVVGSLALAFGVGAPFGAAAGSWFSKQYLADIATYRIWFGALVTLIALRVLYEAWRPVRGERSASGVESANARLAAAPDPGEGPRTIVRSWRACRVRFDGESYDFHPATAAAGGFAISFVGAALGVAGGFLATPFMASVLLFPLYLVLGTALVALMVPLVVSVATYLALQVDMNWWLMAVEVPGVIAGSFLGPALNRYMNEKLLKTFVATVLLALGVYYVCIAR